MLDSYGKIYAIGHRQIRNIFDSEVTVEEKVDGSQFSFGVNEDYVLFMKSKGATVYDPCSNKQFNDAVATAVGLWKRELLVPGYKYRGESICRPKHNTLVYSRTPIGCIAIFDIDKGNQDYMTWEEKREHAAELGLEVVPLMFRGKINSFDDFMSLLDTLSFLGNEKIEGLVFKNYAQFTQTDGRVVMGKYVREGFKERNHGEFRSANPEQKDILEKIVYRFTTPARWNKAVEHLRDEGKIEDEPKDIGLIIREIQRDVLEECEDEMKAMLFNWAWDKAIKRGIVRGVPEWYKLKIAEDVFDGHDTVHSDVQQQSGDPEADGQT